MPPLYAHLAAVIRNDVSLFNCLCDLFATKAQCVLLKMSCVQCVYVCVCVLWVSLFHSSINTAFTIDVLTSFLLVYTLTFTLPDLCLPKTLSPRFIAVICDKLQCAEAALEKRGKKRVAIEPSTALSIGQIYGFIVEQPLEG